MNKKLYSIDPFITCKIEDGLSPSWLHINKTGSRTYEFKIVCLFHPKFVRNVPSVKHRHIANRPIISSALDGNLLEIELEGLRVECQFFDSEQYVFPSGDADSNIIENEFSTLLKQENYLATIIEITQNSHALPEDIVRVNKWAFIDIVMSLMHIEDAFFCLFDEWFNAQAIHPGAFNSALSPTPAKDLLCVKIDDANKDPRSHAQTFIEGGLNPDKVWEISVPKYE